MLNSVLILGKKGDLYCEKASELAKQTFQNVVVITGRRGDTLPEEASSWKGDLLISYLSPWIIPATLLSSARTAAINFHPGPPDYPGIGCTNFALYNEEKTFGVTCHHMYPAVDTGPIIGVRRFNVQPHDTVWTLTQQCYEHIHILFCEVIAELTSDRPLPVSEERWMRLPFRRSELNALCEIKPDMTEEEIRRRVRAVTYPGMPGAYVLLGGKKFIYSEEPIKSSSQ